MSCISEPIVLNDFSLKQSPGCLSNLQLDRLMGDELTSEEQSTAEEHITRCRECRARHEEFERLAVEFLDQRPEPAFALLEAKRKLVSQDEGALVIEGRFGALSRRYYMGASAAVVLAAAFLFYFSKPVVPAFSPPDSGAPAENAEVVVRPHDAPFVSRSKGASRLSYSVKRGEQRFGGEEGDVLLPGDQVRFFVNASKPRHVAILSRDGAGVISRYFPESKNSQSSSLAPGQPLPFAIELDEVLGEERVFAVFCDAVFALAPLEKSLELEAALYPPEEGCSIDEISWEKKSRL